MTAPGALRHAPVPLDEDRFPVSELARIAQRTWILKHARKAGVGAEFGVFRGHFSVEIVRHTHPARLFLVDPWTKLGVGFGWGERDPYTNCGNLTTEQAFADARWRVANEPGGETCVFVEDYCADFCALPDIRLDWAYLDTTHRYGDTLDDLLAIDTVLEEGGVIMGDDWYDDAGHIHHGVLRAVNDFIRLRDYELVAAGPGAQFCIRRTPAYASPRRDMRDRTLR